MQDLYFPSWVSCLDESISIWNMIWTCPGYSVHESCILLANDYQIIADAHITILFAAEIVMGKDTSEYYVHQYEEEKGKKKSYKIYRIMYYALYCNSALYTQYCIITGN